MNKIIPTEDRVFMSMVGPAASGKSHLIFQMLKNGTFVPIFDKIFYFYQYFQKLYAEMQKEVRNIEFDGSLEFDFIENLPNDGTNYLIIFDDHCDEIPRSRQFEKIAIAGRHRKLNCIYKNNLLHRRANGRHWAAKYTHCAVQVTTRFSTNWCTRKTTWIGEHYTEVVCWCNIGSIWSFNDWFITQNKRSFALLYRCYFISDYILFTEQ